MPTQITPTPGWQIPPGGAEPRQITPTPGWQIPSPGEAITQPGTRPIQPSPPTQPRGHWHPEPRPEPRPSQIQPEHYSPGTPEPAEVKRYEVASLTPAQQRREQNILDITQRYGYSGQLGEKAREIEARQGIMPQMQPPSMVGSTLQAGGYVYQGVTGYTQKAGGELRDITIREGANLYTVAPVTGEVLSVQNQSIYLDLPTSKGYWKDTTKPLDFTRIKDYTAIKKAGVTADVVPKGATEWYAPELEATAKQKGARALAETTAMQINVGFEGQQVATVSRSGEDYVLGFNKNIKLSAADKERFYGEMSTKLKDWSQAYPYAEYERMPEGGFKISQKSLAGEPGYLASKSYGTIKEQPISGIAGQPFKGMSFKGEVKPPTQSDASSFFKEMKLRQEGFLPVYGQSMLGGGKEITWGKTVTRTEYQLPNVYEQTWAGGRPVGGWPQSMLSVEKGLMMQGMKAYGFMPQLAKDIIGGMAELSYAYAPGMRYAVPPGPKAELFGMAGGFGKFQQKQTAGMTTGLKLLGSGDIRGGELVIGTGSRQFAAGYLGGVALGTGSLALTGWAASGVTITQVGLSTGKNVLFGTGTEVISSFVGGRPISKENIILNVGGFSATEAIQIKSFYSLVGQTKMPIVSSMASNLFLSGVLASGETSMPVYPALAMGAAWGGVSGTLALRAEQAGAKFSIGRLLTQRIMPLRSKSLISQEIRGLKFGMETISPKTGEMSFYGVGITRGGPFIGKGKNLYGMLGGQLPKVEIPLPPLEPGLSMPVDMRGIQRGIVQPVGIVEAKLFTPQLTKAYEGASMLAFQSKGVSPEVMDVALAKTFGMEGARKLVSALKQSEATVGGSILERALKTPTGETLSTIPAHLPAHRALRYFGNPPAKDVDAVFYYGGGRIQKLAKLLGTVAVQKAMPLTVKGAVSNAFKWEIPFMGKKLDITDMLPSPFDVQSPAPLGQFMLSGTRQKVGLLGGSINIYSPFQQVASKSQTIGMMGGHVVPIELSKSKYLTDLTGFSRATGGSYEAPSPTYKYYPGMTPSPVSAAPKYPFSFAGMFSPTTTSNMAISVKTPSLSRHPSLSSVSVRSASSTGSLSSLSKSISSSLSSLSSSSLSSLSSPSSSSGSSKSSSSSGSKSSFSLSSISSSLSSSGSSSKSSSSSSKSSSSSSSMFSFRVSPPSSPPSLPGWSLGSISRLSQTKKKKKPSKAGQVYVPSIAGIGLGLRIKSKTVKKFLKRGGVYSGAEIRPVPILSKKELREVGL